ncbi:MAG: DUF948 domain-containing protein [Nitrospirae bacterium]|nr:MAG: DUF948 domain-containing protein [Nitrospirota bacterium]
MMVDAAAVLVAVSFAVLVGVLVPLVAQLRKTIAESQQLLARLNAELPPLLRDLRVMTENVNDLADQARDGVEHASVLLHAVGEVGETVQQVHQTVRGKGGTLLMSLASMVAGIRAASAVVKNQLHGEGGHSNGGR